MPTGTEGTEMKMNDLRGSYVAQDALRPAANAFQLTADEAARFCRIVAESATIKSHYQLYRWMNGELQQFLPHQLLISAWGNFAKWSLKIDVISSLPGVRTAQIAQCRMDDLLREAYAQWIAAGRQPVVLKANEASGRQMLNCSCTVHDAIRSMRSILVHGLTDDRGGDEGLYVMLTAGSFTRGRCKEGFLSLLEPLIAQIDIAFRKVPAYPLDEATYGQALVVGGVQLSTREQEILDWLYQGKTNTDISMALEISPFTVKNHVQRILKKLGAENRTQAAARYRQALEVSRRAARSDATGER
jgi:transcriptional regulator EpsA